MLTEQQQYRDVIRTNIIEARCLSSFKFTNTRTNLVYSQRNYIMSHVILIITEFPLKLSFGRDIETRCVRQWRNYWPRRPRNAGGGRDIWGAQKIMTLIFSLKIFQGS